jgi:hypothetical protein
MRMSATMDRSRWLQNVLEVVAQFASDEFQRAAWVELNGPEGASFEEASELLDDYQLEAALSSPSNPYQLQPGERKVLLEFWRTLDDFSRNVYETRAKRPGENYASPKRIISQPEWHGVREKALAVLKSFKAGGFSPMPRLPIFDRNIVELLKGFWEV